MTKFNQQAAINQALELAKAVCENPNVSISATKESATELADFIRTLEARFLSGE